MRFYQFVLKNVFRRKVRSLLTATGMAVAVGVVVAFLGVADGFKKSFLEVYSNQGVDLIVAKKGLNVTGSSLPDELGPKIAALEGVEWVSPGLLDFTSFEDLGLYNVLVQGWPTESPLFASLEIIGGKRLSDPAVGKNGVMLSQRVAEAMKKKVGDKIALYEDDSFRVVGIFESKSFLENSSMLLSLPEMQQLTRKPHQINGATVKVKAGADIQEIKRKIETSVAAEIKMKGTLEAQFYSDYAKNVPVLKIADAMALITSAIALSSAPSAC